MYLRRPSPVFAIVLALLLTVTAPLPIAAATGLNTTECLPVAGLQMGTVPPEITRLRAVLSVENGLAALSYSDGVTAISGADAPTTVGGTNIGFEGTVSEVQAALSGLKVRGLATGEARLSLVVTPAGASYLASNGHYYAGLAGTYGDWTAASAAASGSTYNGLTGYLATVTSAAEVQATASLGVGGWLGGSDAAKDGEWRWVTGPEQGQLFSYTNWAAGEPNNFFAEGETHLEMKSGSGLWNDARATEPLAYAIVEYGGTGQQIMAPQTSELVLPVTLGTGVIADPRACDPLPKNVRLQLAAAESKTAPVEIDLVGTPTLANPFDLEQADAWGEFTSPTGKKSKAPFFWFQDFGANGEATGNGGFRIRLKPNEAGEWSLSADGNVGGVDLDKVVTPIKFQVAEIAPDQIDVSGTSFIKGGKPFVPIGYNIAWSRANSLRDYEKWFREAAKYGANWVRLWMASWSLGIEWKDTGLGDYSKRMNRAKQLDQVFEIAAKYGIQIDLVFLNHGAFSETTNPEWKDNPYNVDNGGPLESPAEFATSEVARKFWLQRLHYIAARWSAMPSLGVWEWWNEVDFTPIGQNDLQDWIQVSDDYLKTVDPYDHLTTNSWASGGSLRDWSKVDFASVHIYNDGDPLTTIFNLAESMKAAVPDKPTIVAEMGSNAAGEDPMLDPTGIHMHNGQWSAIFAGMNSASMYWWWDEYIDPLGLWKEVKGLKVLVSGSDVSTMSPRRFNPAKSIVGRALVGSTRSLVWLRHKDYSRDARIKLITAELVKALAEGRKPRKIGDPVVGAARIKVPVSGAGRFSVQVLHARTGKVLARTEGIAKAGAVIVQVPRFKGDVAIRLIRK